MSQSTQSFSCHLATPSQRKSPDFIVFPPSYLHYFGALGPFAGAGPAQDEDNLRLHDVRHPLQQTLRRVTEQAAQHKPAPSERGSGAVVTGECVSVVSVGGRTGRLPLPLLTSSTNEVSPHGA